MSNKLRSIIPITVLSLIFSRVYAADDPSSIVSDIKSQSLSANSNAKTIKPAERRNSVQLGCIDLNQVFISTPMAKRFEKILDQERKGKKQQLESLQSNRATQSQIDQFRTTAEKELQERFTAMRQEVIDNIGMIIKEIAASKGLQMVYDKSAQATSKTPFLMYSNESAEPLDITEDVLARAQSDMK